MTQTSVGRRPPKHYRDPRLPEPGSQLTRNYLGQLYRVTVREDGFVWRGGYYRSLSGVARAITGYANVNGYAFFGLTNDGSASGVHHAPAATLRPRRAA